MSFIMKSIRHGIFLLLLLALALAAAAAFAAPAQTFDALLADYGLDAADPQVRAHILTADESMEVLDLDLRLQGLYYDGQRLLLGWNTYSLEPESPSLVICQGITIGGVSVGGDAGFPCAQWWPRVFGVVPAGEPDNDFMGGFYTDQARAYGLQGTLEIAAAFTVLQPKKPLVVVDANLLTPSGDAAAEADRQSQLTLLEEYGIPVAQSGDLDAAAWRARGYLPISRAGEPLILQAAAYSLDTLSTALYADTAEYTLALTVDFDALAAGR